jgi:hypothetical protein
MEAPSNMASYGVPFVNPDIIDIIANGPILSMGTGTTTATTIQAEAVVEEVCAAADFSETYLAIERVVNTYLLQFEPMYLVAAIILGLTLAYIVFPRLPYILMSLILFMKLTDDIYTFHKESAAFKPLNQQMPHYIRFLIFGGIYMYCVGQWLK